MSQNSSRVKRSFPIEPYWIIIAVVGMVAAVVYIYHLATGVTPSRVAIHIAALNFDIYWYGIIIVFGIALGTYVTGRLALERGQVIFSEYVPPTVQEKSLDELALPAEINSHLDKRGVTNLGRLLLEWGYDPRRLGLNDAGQEEVSKALADFPEIQDSWLDDAPWRRWNPDHVWGGIAWILVLAIIGARLYHVLTPSPSMTVVGINSAADYLRNPMQLINVRSGGLGIFGGLAGGALGLLIYARRNRISAIAWADLGVVGVALGQSIGRWGNFFNQELYGRPTDMPWAVIIDPIYRLDAYENFSRFHPAFLYASLWNLLTFFVLYVLARRYREKLQVGDLVASYLVLFALGRILLELVRLDSRTVSLGGVDLGLPVATLVSIVVALPMLALLIWRHVLDRGND